jgi:4-phytase/acid phosphatase
MRLFSLVVLLACTSLACAQEGDTLTKLVVMSRHGVRTPLPAPGELANWAAQPWPEWNQPQGALTPQGAKLAALMGAYYHELLSDARAMPRNGCPPAGGAYVYADVLERTRATAQAIVDGFAPGCGIAYRTAGGVSVDPLFHPLEAAVCKVDPLVAQTRVLERAGGDLNSVVRNRKAEFDALQSVLDCCKPALCTAFGRGERCALADLPTALVAHPDGTGVSLIGALPIASTTSELLLLEYADGMPTADVGWGRATLAKMSQTWRLHTEQFDLMERTPYLARKMGSALLSTLAAAVAGSTDPAVRDAKLVAYVGHDTNIWNLAGMLGVSWQQPGYQRNQTPPAGALVFEVRETREKKRRVYVSYVAQSPDQMRNATPLTAGAGPLRTPLRVPGCSTAPGFACTIEQFAAAVGKVLDRACVK